MGGYVGPTKPSSWFIDNNDDWEFMEVWEAGFGELSVLLEIKKTYKSTKYEYFGIIVELFRSWLRTIPSSYLMPRIF